MSSSPHQLRVTFFNQTFAQGGAERLYHDLFSWLSEHHVSITVYTTYPRFGDLLSHLNRVRVHHLAVVIDLIGDWKGFLKGLLLLPVGFFYYAVLVFINRRTDLLLLSGYIEKVLATPWARLFGVPVIWLEHAPLYDFLKIFAGFPRLLYRLTCRLPQKIVVVSRHTQADLTSRFNCPDSLVVLIPNALTLPPVQVRNSSSTSGYPTVCCVSRLQPGKGQDVLLQAWSQVIRHLPTARLVIVGEGDFLPHLRQLVKQYQLTSSVTFTGWVPDVSPYLSASHVVAFPTQWSLEGFGLVALEAMAHSKPVVGFEFGPLPEIVTPQTGILVPSGDSAALASALTRLLKHPRLAARLGRSGHRRYLNQFTFATAGPCYLRLFRHVVSSA